MKIATLSPWFFSSVGGMLMVACRAVSETLLPLDWTELKNVPPGDYTVAVWQEKLGELTQPASLAASASQQLDFAFTAGK